VIISLWIENITADRAPMTHPGEQFYPEGLHWDDPIARGTLPDLLSKRQRNTARGRRSNSATPDQLC